MRKVRTKGAIVAALLLANGPLWAAGFTCDQAKSSIEQSICKDSTLMQLDSEMSQSFAQARARAGQNAGALLIDQRNWLIRRNVAILIGGGIAADAYKARIVFLNNLFIEPENASPLLSAIAAHMIANPSAAKGRGRVIGFWAFLGGDGSVFKVPTEQVLDDAKSLPFDIGDVKKLIDDPNDQPSSRRLALLDDRHLGGIYVTQGTIDSVTWTLFTWDGHGVHAVALPEVLDGNDWTTIGSLAEYQGKVYALQNDDGALDASDIQAQPYVDGNWDDPVRLELRYDVRFLPASSYCSDANCDELVASAGKLIARYNTSRDVDALSSDLSADEQGKFNILRQHAENHANIRQLAVLPDFGGRAKYQGDITYSGFDGRNYFPVRWHGEILLGRIGGATLGWRQSEDLLLGMWRWDGRVFVPVLGAVVHKQRGNFLLSAWLPAKPNATP